MGMGNAYWASDFWANVDATEMTETHLYHIHLYCISRILYMRPKVNERISLLSSPRSSLYNISVYEQLLYTQSEVLSSKLGTKLPLPFSDEVRKSLITAWTGTVYGRCSLMLMPQGFTFAAPMAIDGKATRFLWVQSVCLDTWFVLQEFCAHALWISLRNWLNTSIMSNGAFAVPSAWHE